MIAVELALSFMLIGVGIGGLLEHLFREGREQRLRESNADLRGQLNIANTVLDRLHPPG